MRNAKLKIEFSGLALVETSPISGQCVLSVGVSARHAPCLYLPAETIDQRFGAGEIAAFGLDVIPLPTGLFLIECRIGGAQVKFVDDQGKDLKGPVVPVGAEAKYKKQARKKGARPAWGRLAHAIDLADIVTPGTDPVITAGPADGVIALPAGRLASTPPARDRDRARIYAFLRGGKKVFEQKLSSVLELTSSLPSTVVGVVLSKGTNSTAIKMTLPDGNARVLASAQCACQIHAKDELKEFDASLAEPKVDTELDYSDHGTIPHGICPSAYHLG